MKKILYILALTISMNAFSLAVYADEKGFDKTIVPTYSERQNYYIDKGELSTYISELYKGLSGKELPEVENTFTDININTQDYIPKLVSLGIMSKTSDTEFSPEKTLTGDEFSSVITNTIKSVYPDIEIGESSYEFLKTRGIWDNTAKRDQKITLGNAINMIDATLKSAPEFKIVEEPKKESSNPVTYDKIAYLTFDDSPSENTIKILDTLKEYNVKATFYLTGKADPEIIKRMVDEGHAIGNHTYSHDYAYIYSSVDNFFEDFYKEEAYLESIIGYKPKLVRLPGGSNNTVSNKYGGSQIMKEITAELTKRGYIYTDWNSEAKDATTKNITPQQVKDNIFSTVSKNRNAVVLMHQTVGKEATAEALPSVIEEFKKLGFGFDVISETSYKTQFTLK